MEGKKIRDVSGLRFQLQKTLSDFHLNVFYVVTDYNGNDPNVKIPEHFGSRQNASRSLHSVLILKACAFSNIKTLRSVTIPESLLEIEDRCFQGCSSLKEVVFDGTSKLHKIGAYAFSGSGIERLKLPASLREIGTGCFATCHYLSDLSFKENNIEIIAGLGVAWQGENEVHIISGDATEIPTHAFAGFKFLKRICIYEDVEITKICEKAFERSGIEHFVIPNTVQEISAGCFHLCENLQAVEFDEEVEISCLGGMDGLIWRSISMLTIPSSIEEIPAGCFSGIKGLKKVLFRADSKLKKIGKFAFHDSSLEIIEIPQSIKEIGEMCFYNCKNIKYLSIKEECALEKIADISVHYSDGVITVAKSVTKITRGAFAGLLFIKEVLFEQDSMLTTIENMAFIQTKLDRIVLPPGITTIGSQCLQDGNPDCEVDLDPDINIKALAGMPINWTSPTKISIPASVKHIPTGFIAGFTCVRNVEIDKDAAVETIGANAFAGCSSLTEFKIPSTVTEIGAGAFHGCNAQLSLTGIPRINRIAEIDIICNMISSITIPYTVTEIPARMFSGWTVLENIRFQETAKLRVIGDYAFHGCTGLVSFMFPSSLKEIGAYCFYGCNITEKMFPNHVRIEKIAGMEVVWRGSHCITIPDDVTEIPAGCFTGFANLKEVLFGSDSKCEKIGDNAFYGSGIENITLPNGKLEIGCNCFGKCSSLTDVSMDKTKITKIAGIDVTWDKSTVIIGENVREIPAQAFNNFKNLEKIRFEGTSVHKIGDYAFYGSNIVDVAIPESVSELGKCCFENCPNLKTIRLQNVSQIQKIAGIDLSWDDDDYLVIDSTVIPESCFAGCKLLENVKLGPNVRAIGPRAFTGASLVNVVMPEKIAVISPYCFHNTSGRACKFHFGTIDRTNEEGMPIVFGNLSSKELKCQLWLQEVILPRSTTEIPAGCFAGCRFIKEVNLNIPGLRKIGNWAFSDTSIEWINLPPAIEILGSYCFKGCDKLFEVCFPEHLDEEEDPSLTIGDYAFSGSGIERLIIPENTKEIGAYCLHDCRKLEVIDFENVSRVSIGGIKVTWNGKNKVTIPCTVTCIPDGCFSGFRCLEEVVFADKSQVSYIGDDAFALTQIKHIYIPDSVENIGVRCFADCLSDSLCLSFENSTELNAIGDCAFENTHIKVIGPKKLEYLFDHYDADFERPDTMKIVGTQCDQLPYVDIPTYKSTYIPRDKSSLVIDISKGSDQKKEKEKKPMYTEEGDLGKGGGYGEVILYKENESGKKIVVKKLRRDAYGDKIENCFDNEVDMLFKFSFHGPPCVAAFHGYSWMKLREDGNDSNDYIIATDYYQNGSLADVMENNPNWWNSTRKLIALYGVAVGMVYIHSHGCVHADLKPGNILLDDMKYPRICDFGSCSKLDPDITRTCPPTTPVYSAPEILLKKEFDTKADVFSYGVTMRQLLTDTSQEDMGNQKCFEGISVWKEEHEKLTPDALEMIQKCLSPEKDDRPTFADIVQKFNSSIYKFTKEDFDMNKYFEYRKYIELHTRP